jgi:hypothetical protein
VPSLDAKPGLQATHSAPTGAKPGWQVSGGHAQIGGMLPAWQSQAMHVIALTCLV